MRLIVHSHIPKTGGTALNQRLFFRRFVPEERVVFYQTGLQAVPYAEAADADLLKGRIFAAGHVPVGFLDRIMPATYVSIFREPVERYLSFASFVVSAANHPVATLFNPDIRPRAKADPDSYVRALLANRRVRAMQSNLMTRMLSHRAFLGTESASRQDLATALRNLERPDFAFGLQERFEEFVSELCSAFGWSEDQVFERDPRAMANERFNRFDFRIRQADLEGSTTDLIRQGQEFDLVFYERALALLAGRPAKLPANAHVR